MRAARITADEVAPPSRPRRFFTLRIEVGRSCSSAASCSSLPKSLSSSSMSVPLLSRGMTSSIIAASFGEILGIMPSVLCFTVLARHLVIHGQPVHKGLKCQGTS